MKAENQHDFGGNNQGWMEQQIGGESEAQHDMTLLTIVS